jgi:hypothetical protein
MTAAGARTAGRRRDTAGQVSAAPRRGQAAREAGSGRHGRGVPTVVLWVAAGLAVAAAVLVTVFAARDGTAPVWMDDELGYLANAQLLSGAGPTRSMGALGYYSGWSVVLVPLWWALDDPEQVYRGAVLLSAACNVVLIAPLACIAHRAGRLLPPAAVLVAATVVASPARTVLAGYALAEAFITLLAALVFLAGARYAERPTTRRAAVLALGVVYLFFSHGRGLPVVLATAAWFLLHVRHHRRGAVWGLGLLVAGAAAAYWANQRIIATVYDAVKDREADALTRFLSNDPVSLLVAVTGQVFYQASAWLGLSVVGALVLAGNALLGVRHRRRPGVAAWWLLSVLGAAVLTVGFVSSFVTRGSLRGDVFVYGRYLEPFVTVLAVVGLAVVVRGVSSRLAAGAAAVSLASVAGFWVLAAPRSRGSDFLAPINTGGLLQWDWPSLGPATAPPWVPASVTAVLAAALLLLARRAPTRRGRALLAVGPALTAFVAFSVLAETNSARVYDAPWKDAHPLRFAAERAQQQEPDAALSYDIAGSDPVSRNGYQFYLASERVPVVDSRTALPTTPLVLSRRHWPAGEAAGARRMAADRWFDDALWLLPGPPSAALAAAGFVEPAELSAPLPAPALEADVSPVDGNRGRRPVAGDGSSTVDLRVRHTGGGATWPALGTLDDPTGAVRLVLWWFDGTTYQPQVVDLPRSVVPGDQVVVRAALTPPDSVPAADTHIRVVLVQEGVRAFSELDDPALILDVAVSPVANEGNAEPLR